MKLKTLSIALAALLMAASASWAATTSDFILDDDDEEDGVIELSDTYVRPELTDIERLRKTKEVIILDKKKLQDKGNRNVADALKHVTSVSVNSSVRGSIDIRGQGEDASSRNINIMLDGAPITPLTTHPFSRDMNVIPVEQLDSIEVIPGGGSVIYGSGAQGGVINMTSSLHAMKKPRKTISGQWAGDGKKATAALGHSFFEDKLMLEATASMSKQDLEFVDTYDNSKYYALGARIALPANQTLLIRGSRFEGDSKFIWNAPKSELERFGKNYKPPYVKFYSKPKDSNPEWRRDYKVGDRTLDSASLSHKIEVSDSLKISTEAFLLKGTFHGSNQEKHELNTKDKGMKTKVDWDYSETGHLLLGADLLAQESRLGYQDIGYAKSRPLTFNYKRDTAALFFVNTNKIGRFELSEGYRRDMTLWKFSKQDLMGKGTGDRRTWNNAVSLSAGYDYSDTGNLYARYERGFSTPDGMLVTDQFTVNKQRVYVPSNAKDEKFDMVEIGWRDAFEWTTASLTAWYSRTPNQLARPIMKYKGKSARVALNMLNTQRWGFDAKLNQTFGKLELEESYSFLRGVTKIASIPADYEIITLNNPLYRAKGLIRVPRHKLQLTARLNIRHDLGVETVWLYKGKYKGLPGQEEDELVKGYSTLDLNMDWTPTQHLKVYGGIYNVLDEKYFVSSAETSAVPGRERTFFVGLKATF